jgi:hydroxymethylpyrimidine pyrophosphatase-like HAD family hydrolase
MPRYRLLAIDIDGTLVNSRDELTPAVRAALGDAAAAGIRLVLATGRRFSRTLHLVEPLGIDVLLVTGNGTLVKDPLDHRTLYQASFDRGVLRRLLAVTVRCGYAPVVHADTFADGFDFYCESLSVGSPELLDYFERNPGHGRPWPNLAADPPPGVYAGFTMGTLEEMLGLEAAIHREMPGEVTTGVLRSPHYAGYICELAPAGDTKWSAIRRLAADWGIREDEICAVGDDINDIAMIREAGLGVAMGNAAPIVKEAADRVAPTHDEDGIVEVVRWLLE